jgi:hypothetical protein
MKGVDDGLAFGCWEDTHWDTVWGFSVLVGTCTIWRLTTVWEWNGIEK